jgi:hypothetical protein
MYVSPGKAFPIKILLDTTSQGRLYSQFINTRGGKEIFLDF